MLRSILSSFARAYGRGLGYSAARKTGWLILPVLVVVGIIVMIEVLGGTSPAELLHSVTAMFTNRGW